MGLHRRPGFLSSGLAIAVVMVLTAALWPTGEATAQDGGRTLTIYKASCPAGYAGDASADECDATPVAGVPFRVGRPLTDFFTTARTDGEGLLVFDIEGLPLRGTIRIIEELAPGTARFVAYCVDEAGAPLAITYEDVPENVPPIGVADVSVGEVGNILCDWYNVPAIGESAAIETEGGRVDEARTEQTLLPEAQVIAEGVDRVPRGSAVWRLTRRQVPTVGGGPAFILPEADPVVVTWEDGREARLDLGDAVYVGEGERASVEAEDGTARPFLTLQLVPAGTAGFAPYEVIAIGDDFRAPAGDHTLELVGATLDAGSSASFDPGIAPALLYVTEGTLEVRYGRGSDVIAAGSALSVGDAAELVASGEGPASYVAARVRAEVAGIETPAPTVGEVAVAVYDCPAGMRPETVDPGQCQYTTGPVVDLRLVQLGGGDFEPRSLREARLDGELYVWDELPFDEYVLQTQSLAEGYDRYLVQGLEGLNTPPELGYTISPNEGYIIPLDAETPAYELPVYVFRTP
jgi:hypothetical protein